MRYILLIILIVRCVSSNQKNIQEPEQSLFVAYSEEIPGSDIVIKMVPVQGASFLMGSPESEAGRNADEGPQRLVEVDPFWMGAHEITWEQYEQFLQEKVENLRGNETVLGNGSKIAVDGVSTATPMYIDMSFGMGREGYPAINMTQYAAIMYTRWLFLKTGNFYRLPTEAEWEWACRSGSKTAYSFGDNSDELDRYAWYINNSGQGYKKAGTKAPNAWGLYDMQGNIAEWTLDQYLEDYHEQLKGKPAVNPFFKPTELYPRSVRGGSWMDDKVALRCAKRRGSSKQWKQRDPQMPKSIWWLTDAPFVGFRLVRPKETPSREEMEKYWIEIMEDY